MSDLPPRRYTCIACGQKGRRSNSAQDRIKEPVCPRCTEAIDQFDIYAALIPFWQKRQELKSPEVREVGAYYQKFRENYDIKNK